MSRFKQRKTFIIDSSPKIRLGLSNRILDEPIAGAIVGLGNEVKTIKGIALAGLGNKIKTNNGVALAGLLNAMDINNGVSLAGGNFMRENNGFMAGLINVCESFKGIQLGMLNMVGSGSRGVQFGLFNIRMNAPWYAKVLPLIAIRWSDKTVKGASAEPIEIY